jgi:hypothetical protein
VVALIVVDVGAMRQGPEESVQKLIDRFHPDLYFAFDPHPEFEEGVETIDGTLVVSRRAAAWTHTGTMRLRVDGDSTGIDQHGDALVECFNFPAWLRALPPNVETVAKFDAEGAEYPLLDAVGDQGLDERLALVIVEWHPVETAHGWFAERPPLGCPVEEWV